MESFASKDDATLEVDSAKEPDSSFGSSGEGKEDEYINILLLGETGVGKSTFINSMANYVRFDSFENAENGDLSVLIPLTAHFWDKNEQHCSIQIGAGETIAVTEDSKWQKVGASDTQNVQTYVFPIGVDGKNCKINVRFIDTPGMGDTRGVLNDDQNCENILSYLAQLEKLHAICFLMRPTNTRITVLFEYCLKQILSRLEKSASDNIIFIFTNTRGCDYKPGDTYPCLQKLIEKIEARPPYVKIPLGKNVFCFDNEPFKMLAAKKQGKEFDSLVQRKYSESWDNSYENFWRMISYIVGGDNCEPLKPHQIKNSVSVNEARNMIVHLTKPIMDISQLIADNLAVLRRHYCSLTMENMSLEEMKTKLYVPVVNLKVVDLPTPVTVCTQPRCAEIYQIRDIRKWHYKQRCHNPCHLRHISNSVVGDAGLKHCDAMEDGKCIECGCDYTMHMHIYYETQTFDDTVKDEKVNSSIQTKDMAINKLKEVVDSVITKKDELTNEREIITKSIAQFAHFLQINAISPYNDAYKAYIQYVIEREKGMGENADEESIKNFELMLHQYEEEKAVFDNWFDYVNHDNSGISDTVISVETVFESIENLFKLKHNGKKIEEIYNHQRTCKNAKFVMGDEYVHPPVHLKPNKKENGLVSRAFSFLVSKVPFLRSNN